MIDKNQLLKWKLEELSSTDGDDIEGNEIEIYGEDEQGREGTFTAEITEIAATALDRIKGLELDLGLSKIAIDQAESSLKHCSKALQNREIEVLALTRETTNASFAREERYLVLKRSDIEKYLTDEDRFQLGRLATEIELGRERDNRGSFSGLVVESDWPEFEPTWKAIEKRVIFENCTHEDWQLAPIAGEGRICKRCGYHDFDFED